MEEFWEAPMGKMVLLVDPAVSPLGFSETPTVSGGSMGIKEALDFRASVRPVEGAILIPSFRGEAKERAFQLLTVAAVGRKGLVVTIISSPPVPMGPTAAQVLMEERVVTGVMEW